MRRRTFLNTTSKAGIGVSLGMNTISSFASPQKIIREPLWIWGWAARFAGLVLTELVVDNVANYIKEWWSPEEEEKEKIRKEVASVNNVLIQNNYNINQCNIYRYDKYETDFYYHVPKTPSAIQRESTDYYTPFFSKKNKDVGCAAELRSPEFICMTLISEMYKKDYSAQIIKEIVMPRKILGREYLMSGGSDGGASIYYTDNGKIAISYEVSTDNLVTANVSYLPNNPIDHSNDIRHKPVKENFKNIKID